MSAVARWGGGPSDGDGDGDAAVGGGVGSEELCSRSCRVATAAAVVG